MVDEEVDREVALDLLDRPENNEVEILLERERTDGLLVAGNRKQAALLVPVPEDERPYGLGRDGRGVGRTQRVVERSRLGNGSGGLFATSECRPGVRWGGVAGSGGEEQLIARRDRIVQPSCHAVDRLSKTRRDVGAALLVAEVALVDTRQRLVEQTGKGRRGDTRFGARVLDAQFGDADAHGFARRGERFEHGLRDERLGSEGQERDG